MKIFLSHSSADQAFVQKLSTALQKRGAECWVDEAEMRPGESLLGKLSSALDECDFIAVILSPDAVSSPWVQQELEVALLREFKSKGVIVLPVLYRDCEMPTFLRSKIWVDFRDLDHDEHRFSERVDVMLAQLERRPKGATLEPEMHHTQVMARNRETIRVILVDAVGGYKYQIEVPLDAHADAVKQALVKRLSMPTSFADGRPVFYHLINKRTGAIIAGHLTLRESDVREGDILSMLVQMMAG